MSSRLRNLRSRRWVAAAVAVTSATLLVCTGPAAADRATETVTPVPLEAASADAPPDDESLDRGSGGVWIIGIDD